VQQDDSWDKCTYQQTCDTPDKQKDRESLKTSGGRSKELFQFFLGTLHFYYYNSELLYYKMKFSTQFEFHKIPEWYSEYLDYKRFKAILKAFKLKVEGNLNY
jgi:hypothetical protein